MSENKHTPEPMFQYQFRQLATYENGRTPVLLTEAQYCRAKSCIDACAGMTSEQVSHGIVSASVFSSVVQQRDELLSALEKCRKELSAWMRDHGDDIATQEAVACARAAIARAKGEQ